MGVKLNTLPYNDNFFPLGDDLALLGLTTSPIFASGACGPAKVFGKEILKYGASAFVGYYYPGSTNNQTAVTLLFDGYSVGDAFKDQINRQNLAWLASQFAYGYRQGISNIDFKVQPPVGVTSLPTYRERNGFILYGDPSFKKNNSLSLARDIG